MLGRTKGARIAGYNGNLKPDILLHVAAFFADSRCGQRIVGITFFAPATLLVSEPVEDVKNKGLFPPFEAVPTCV